MNCMSSSQSLSQVRQVQDLLDRHEIFWMVFLLYDNVDMALQAMHLETQSRRVHSSSWPVLEDSSCFREGNSSSLHHEGFLVEWFSKMKSSHNSSTRKLVEALLIIKNFQCLKIFGKNKNDADIISYVPHQYCTSVEIDLVRKFIFLLVDDLHINEIKSLIKLMNDDLAKKDKMIKQDIATVEEDLPAEYFMLFFMSRGLLKVKRERTEMDFTSLSSKLEKLGIRKWASKVKEFQDLINKEGKACTPLLLPEMKYLLDESYPGFILIINQEKFNGKVARNGDTLEDRFGSEKDAERLIDTFKLLNFRCDIKRNVSAELMHKIIEESIKKFCSGANKKERCFVLALLSHGDENGVYGVDGEMLHIDSVLKLMRSVELKGMPRVILCQACKGNSQVALVNGVPMCIETDQAGSCLTDLLIFSSCVKGFAAYRSQSFGSFFIYTLCKVILLYGSTYDLLRLCNEVIRKMSSYQLTVRDCVVIMTPEIQGTLTKLLSFSVPHGKIDEAKSLVRKWKEEFSSFEEFSKTKLHDEEVNKVNDLGDEGKAHENSDKQCDEHTTSVSSASEEGSSCSDEESKSNDSDVDCDEDCNEGPIVASSSTNLLNSIRTALLKKTQKQN